MSLRLLGVGVLKYKTLRKSLKLLCEDDSYQLIASIEHDYQQSYWDLNIDIFDFYECLSAKYETDGCEPIGSDLLNALAGAEVVFLKMIERLDYRNQLSYDDRKKQYLRHVIFWNSQLERMKIDCVLFFNFPHEMYDYVIYSLCKIKGIRTIIFDDFSVLPDTLFLVESIEESAIEIEKSYRKLLLSKEPLILNKLLDYFEDFYGKNKGKTSPVILGILKEQKIKESLWGKVKFLAKIWRRIYKNPLLIFDKDFGARWKPSMQYQTYKLEKLYRSLQINHVNFKNKYIYLALHYQPENSSCPMGGVFADQWLMVDMIAKNLPENYCLYVKEHPLQKKHGRDPDLYRYIAKLKNVFLVPKSTSSFQLIENCKAVATITGTAGWEAFLMGKPVLKFGSSYYQFAPGVFKIRNPQDIRRAIGELDKKFTVTERERKAFLKAIEEVSITGWVLDFIKEDISKIDVETAVINIFSSLKARLNSAESHLS